jgi:predicted metal-binding protein
MAVALFRQHGQYPNVYATTNHDLQMKNFFRVNFMIEQDKIDIQKLCLDKKAINCKFIDPGSIVVGYWPRFKCQYGCAGYGKSLCCPPHSPTPDETKKIVTDYKLRLLIHFGGNVPVTKTIA